MALFYCPTHRSRAPNGEVHVGAFFDSALHGDAIPTDAIQLSGEAEYARLLEARNDGAEIELTAAGKFKVTRPAIDIAARREALSAAAKQEAARRIDAISPVWRQLNDTREPSPEGAARFAMIDQVRAASAAIESDIAVAGVRRLSGYEIAANPLWPEVS